MHIGAYIVRFLGLSLSLTVSATAFGGVPEEEIAAYLQSARAIVASLEANRPDSVEIAVSITAMLENAKPVLVAFSEKHTQCATQLSRVVELYDQIDSWTAQEIRRNIEGGGVLPPAEGCYPARDVVAHPAIVRALARLGIQPAQHSRLIREMSEAIEHMEGISVDLRQE